MSTSIKSISSSEKNILSNGSLLSFDKGPISIAFGNSQETLIVSLVFETDETNKVNITALPVSSAELKLRINNLDNQQAALGWGPLAPFHIGELDGKQLFFSFRIYTLQNSEQKLVHYTIYEKDRS